MRRCIGLAVGAIVLYVAIRWSVVIYDVFEYISTIWDLLP